MSEGIVYCTCGHLLKETVANRDFIVYTLDHLSSPEYVIKKGRPHGHRYGKTPEKKEYHLAHNLKRDASRGNALGFTIVSCEILIFVNPCSNMIDDDICLKWDDLAEQDFTYRMTESEYFRYKIGGSLSISLETKDH